MKLLISPRLRLSIILLARSSRLRLAVALIAIVVLGLSGLALSRGDADPQTIVAAPSPSAPESSPQAVLPPVEASPTPAPPPPSPISATDDLRARLIGAMRGSTVPRPSVVIDVEGLGRVVSLDPNRSLLPASTQKLYTASALIHHLGTSAHLTTEVFRVGGEPIDGTVRGHLLIVGGGDPSLDRDDLKSLANLVRLQGITRFTGDLYADESRFDSVRGAPGWRASYFPAEVGSLSAFALDGNDWREDEEFRHSPALYNLGVFRELLKAEGIEIDGGDFLGSPVGERILLATNTSPPMSTLLKQVLHISDNFYSEMLTKELGLLVDSPTTVGGLSVIREVAEALGAKTWNPADGSGLSPLNRDTTAGQVAFLRTVERTELGPRLQDSMTVACHPDTEGWYGTRLCDTVAERKVTAKLGAHTRMRSLSGYTKTASGRDVWFSFIFVDIGSVNSAWDAIDRALIELAKFRR